MKPDSTQNNIVVFIANTSFVPTKSLMHILISSIHKTPFLSQLTMQMGKNNAKCVTEVGELPPFLKASCRLRMPLKIGSFGHFIVLKNQSNTK